MGEKIKHGIETGIFGNWLTAYLNDTPGFSTHQVFYDHGDKKVNANVVATKGFWGEKVSNLNRLADVDIVIADANSNILLLIEIEERNSSPKKLLGDVLALLICNRFAVRLNNEQLYLHVTVDTRLIVAGVVPSIGQRLKKVEQVILPRIKQMAGLPDGINPANVELQFSESIDLTLQKLQNTIRMLFPRPDILSS
jgi:hypothetical protein